MKNKKTKFCKNCGAELSPNMEFCPKCNAPVSNSKKKLSSVIAASVSAAVFIIIAICIVAVVIGNTQKSGSNGDRSKMFATYDNYNITQDINSTEENTTSTSTISTSTTKVKK